MDSCTKHLNRSLQLGQWLGKNTGEKIFILVFNLFAMMPGIFYFIKTAYGEQKSITTDLTVFVVALVPLINFLNQVLGQRLLFGFQLSKTGILTSSISLIFFTLSLIPDVPKKFKESTNNSKGRGLLTILFPTILLVSFYAIRFSELGVNTFDTNSKCNAPRQLQKIMNRTNSYNNQSKPLLPRVYRKNADMNMAGARHNYKTKGDRILNRANQVRRLQAQGLPANSYPRYTRSGKQYGG